MKKSGLSKGDGLPFNTYCLIDYVAKLHINMSVPFNLLYVFLFQSF